MQRLFTINEDVAIQSDGSPSDKEKKLQQFVEKHLYTLFAVNFVESEFDVNEYRIDTVGLSKDNCPVLIEYKRGSDKAHVSQILDYLDEFKKHKRSFRWAVGKNEKLKKLNIEPERINFKKIRLICLAWDFNRAAVNEAKRDTNKNLELVTYRFFGENNLLLEWKTGEPPSSPSKPQQATENIQDLCEELSLGIAQFGGDVRRDDKGEFRRFARRTFFACLRSVPLKKKVNVWIKLDIEKDKIISEFIRDVSNIGKQAGNFDWEISVSNQKQLEEALYWCRQAYQEQKSSSSRSSPKPSPSRAKKSASSRPKKRYDDSIEYARQSSSRELQKLFDDFEKEINGFGDATPKYTQVLLKFSKHGKVFACLRPAPKLEKVQIWVSLDPKYEKLRDGFTIDHTYAAGSRWAPKHCNLKITAERQELQEALNLCRKAYNQTRP